MLLCQVDYVRTELNALKCIGAHDNIVRVLGSYLWASKAQMEGIEYQPNCGTHFSNTDFPDVQRLHSYFLAKSLTVHCTGASVNLGCVLLEYAELCDVRSWLLATTTGAAADMPRQQFLTSICVQV